MNVLAYSIDMSALYKSSPSPSLLPVNIIHCKICVCVCVCVRERERDSLIWTTAFIADKDGNGYKPLGGATVNHVHTLLECLTDTFEENKQEALKLLLACTSNNTHLLVGFILLVWSD